MENEAKKMEDWLVWKKLVLYRLKTTNESLVQIKTSLHELKTNLHSLDKRLSSMETKAGIYGSIAGLISGSVITVVLPLLIKIFIG